MSTQHSHGVGHAWSFLLAMDGRGDIRYLTGDVKISRGADVTC